MISNALHIPQNTSPRQKPDDHRSTPIPARGFRSGEWSENLLNFKWSQINSNLFRAHCSMLLLRIEIWAPGFKQRILQFDLDSRFFYPCTVRINSLLRSASQNIKINPTADISQLHFHAHTLSAADGKEVAPLHTVWKVASANLVDSSNISSSFSSFRGGHT